MPGTVEARTGCRIDLAGGTLDIWPLGLLHPGARTVNVALDVAVEVDLGRRQEGYSVTVGDRRFEAERLDDLLDEPEARLFATLAAELDTPPVAARIDSASPRGGGLGASSAIAVALVAAIEALCERPASDAERLARLSRDIEARMMQIPTGVQDHYPAVLGGALEIAYRPGGEVVRRLDADLERLGDCLTLVFTGRSHFSGGTNWQVIRRRLDGEPRTVELFGRIAEIAAGLSGALESGDLAQTGGLVGEEWECRRQLADGVSTPEIERLLEAARRAGAWGGKAGGAGGGGCVVVLHPPEARAAVRRAAEEAGGELVETRPTVQGLVLNRR